MTVYALGKRGNCEYCGSILEDLVKNGCTFLPSRFIAGCTAVRAIYRLNGYMSIPDMSENQA
jgi:hypothetical protein